MTKSDPRDALRTIVTKTTGQNTGGKVPKDSSVTFEWFIRKPLCPTSYGQLPAGETVYRRVLRSFGKTPKSLGEVHMPDGLNEDLLSWKLECPDADPNAFIFPNADGGMMDTANYRSRVLTPMAKKLGIPKLNFQIIRRTIPTRAQKLGSIKDIQAHLRHTRSDTAANEYVQELAESVQLMVESFYKQHNKRGKNQGFEVLPPNACGTTLVSY
jgi:hypothetical protein